ncbi:MAG: hypothetical protein KIT84_39265 [Labilithrix sp.]|nr:hypothetical protein [Labilithrix sp.]MCW5817102.1 hypothetical protein [Labilithrix sp.]
MGPEPLRTAAIAFALVASCAAPASPPPTIPAPATRHVQIVRALTTPERLALVAKLRARSGAGWEVNEAALATSGTVVDPFAGFLRRARNTAPRPAAAAPVTEEEAIAAARAFVRTNADLLALPHAVLLTFAVSARPVEPRDHAGARARWAVRFETTFPTKGYEAFAELENEVDLEVFVDDDGAPSMLANVSAIHPRLFLDTRPDVDAEDPRLYAKLLGRRVFALADDDTPIPLGHVERGDFQRANLVVFRSPGPLGAWMTYRLAWNLGAAKAAIEEPGAYYFFAWIVDADSGDVVADAVPPRRWEVP